MRTLEIYLTPPISVVHAHLLTLLFAITYVGSLYLSKHARLSFRNKSISVSGGPRRKFANERWRDDPEVIRARLVIVTSVTLFCCSVVFGVISAVARSQNSAWYSAVVRLGFGFDHLRSLYPFCLTPLLYAGPLYALYLGERLPFQYYFSLRKDFVEAFFSWQGLRNYIFGPITEEVVFRACVLSLYHLAGASTTWMIFFTPISFGFAHLHHAWDIYNRYGRTSTAVKRAAFTTLFQLSYTTLFGAYCAYLFLVTGSIYPPIFSHIFCNIMGLPQLSYELERFPNHRKSILCAYGIGIVGFAAAIRSSTFGYSIYWPRDPRMTRHI